VTFALPMYRGLHCCQPGHGFISASDIIQVTTPSVKSD